ncbi:MAG: GNAT family N-acetyltransferase [Akkermansia sp.]
MILRPFAPGDARAAAQLFRDTVLRTTCRDYSAEQRRVWAAAAEQPERWASSFAQHVALVAEEDGQMLGFGDLDPRRGYLDRLYTHCGHQGRGVASRICEALERAAVTERITVHASLTARGFFERRGYVVLREQLVERGGVWLPNVLMERRLPRDARG